MRAVWLLLFALTGCTRNDTPARDAPVQLVPNAVAATASPTPSMPTAPHWRFVGRWIPDDGGMRCAWSGSYVVARFKGTEISARIKDEGFNLLHVVIDGETKKVLRTDKAKGEASYVLATGLSDGVHDITVHRRTEARVGELVFYGFEGATMLPAPPPAERRIEIIGDSISTGFGNEGPGAACGYVNSEQNETATYGAIAAQALGAEHTTIAWSGKTVHEMTEYFDKVLPQRDGAPLWDFASWQPQAVVLNLGTNNFANIDPGEKRFVGVYLELVHKVRAAYPSAFIVCALGSMLSDVYPEKRKNLTQARKYMKTAVSTLREQGDTNLDFLEFPEQNHADGLGCGFHPSLKTHRLMGERLAAFLRERLAW
jgi:lysophospholipase L1-like esterase